ncbi:MULTISPECIES: DISARM system-associated protein DrmE [Saccharibacillus]|uniref:DISARM system-associated protein DrmE n=1 Tax=Saccharibacillus TaxID=456492 RepID=UPI00123BF296|nr:DISARM system-associated protein DrmE [Saccharibacillus sp. WB 17]MWJ30921.1 hypothetical protein [Saccharibacillus sp. WB 17]
MIVIEPEPKDISTIEDKQRSNLENMLMNKTKTAVADEKPFILCHPDKDYWIDLIIKTTISEYVSGYKKREDFKRRLSVLIISIDPLVIDKLLKVNISKKIAFQMGFDRHRFFSEQGEFCAIDDKDYFQCNIKHYLEKGFESKVPEAVPLHYILPLAIGYTKFSNFPRGNRNKIGQYDNKQQAVFYVSASLNIMEKDDLPFFDHIFVDCASSNDLIKPSFSATSYFFDSCMDKRLTYLNNNREFYNFDPKLIPHLKLQNNAVLLNQLKNKDVQRLEISYIDTRFEECLSEAFEYFGLLRKRRFDPYDLSLAGRLLYIFLNTPVSAVEYDMVADEIPGVDTIQNQLKELKQSENRYEDDDFESLIKCLETMLNKHKLDYESPKQDELFSRILEERRKGKSVGILSPGRVVSIALKEQLASKLNTTIEEIGQQNVFLFNRKKVLKGSEKIKCDTLLLFTASSLEDLRILQIANYQQAEVLLYRIERSLLQSKLERMLTLNNNLLDNFSHSREQLTTYSLYRYFLNRIKLKNNELESENFDVLDFIKNIKSDVQISMRKNRPYEGKDAVEAYYIKFADGSGMFLSTETVVKVLNRNKQSQEEIYLESIETGSEILIIDLDAKKDLYDVFIESSDKGTEKKEHFKVIARWHELFEDRYVVGKWNQDKLYKQMRLNGWKRKSKQNFDNWRSRLYYGPQDVEDIIQLGQVMKVEDFIENAVVYQHSMNTIRSEHRQISKILNALIYDSTKGLSGVMSKKLSEYNLTVDRLKEAVKIKTILTISEQPYLVKPGEVGIIYKE